MFGLQAIGYLCWEFALLAWGAWLASVVLRADDPRERADRDDENVARRDLRFVTLALLFNMMSACAAGSAVSFARCNGPRIYLILAAVSLVIVARSRPGLTLSLKRLRESIGGVARSVPLATRLLIATLGIALLWIFIKPTCEWDSISQLSTMENWLHNRTTPYQSVWHYVVFPELGYMPAMAITRRDQFFWLISLKPLLLLGLLLYQVGLIQRLSTSLAALAAFNLLAMFHVLPLGLPTLKNDMTHACGMLLFVVGGLRILRGVYDREAGVLLAAAMALMTVKYSGLLESAAGLGLLGALAGRDLIRHRGQVWRWAVLAGLAGFLVSGHYYTYNALKFGNPLYPFQLNIGSLVLPGNLDLRGTSILDYLKEARLWRAFFPTDRISPAGLWFPLTFACSLLLFPAMLARRTLAAVRGRPGGGGEAFVLAFALAVWMIYFRSFYSAANIPGHLKWVQPESLFSLRYVEGVIGLGEVLLLGLIATRCSRFLAYALVLTSLASRIWIARIKGWPPLEAYEPVYILVGAGVSSLLAAWIAGRVRTPKAQRALAWSVATLVVVVLIPWRYEVQRERTWPSPFKPVWEVTIRKPRGAVFFVTRDDGPPPILYHYHVVGGHFDRTFIPLTEEQIARSGRPRRAYVVRLNDFYEHSLDNYSLEVELREFEARMERLGYEIVASNRFSTLMRPAPGNRVAGGRDGAVIR